jgi:RsiW-degrading membrane proteinase PrsW (M82 family)
MDEFYWLRVSIIYLVGILIGLKIGLTSYFKDGLEWKQHNAAVVLLSFVWPVVVGLMLFSAYFVDLYETSPNS